MKRNCWLPLLVILLGSVSHESLSGELSEPQIAEIDKLFSAYAGENSPGCSIAIHWGGEIVFSRAYGMADLEHGIANTVDTVFECGSISKQFTAAAVVLLSLEGKLSLDDDIRKYVPEVPCYGKVITIRHLLHHTSGLRDWGSIARLAGWPRGSRAHTHGDVLRILARQRELNHQPGEHYSYTNSGYNLLAIIVGRVSGESFAKFSRRRIFEPLGMERTEWRDDYRRIVRDRAIAYEPVFFGRWQMEMPFENVHGNGGLLTTPEELLKFTGNLETGLVGGPRFVEAMHQIGTLNDGSSTFYASGLFVKEFRGLREISHGGATAGYRAYLARYPDQDLAIAMVSNAANMRTQNVQRIVAMLCQDDIQEWERQRIRESQRLSRLEPETDKHLQGLAGAYRNRGTGVFVSARQADNGIVFSGTQYSPSQDGLLRSASNSRIDYRVADAESGLHELRVESPFRPPVSFDQVSKPDREKQDLSEYIGIYESAEVGAIYRVREENRRLRLSIRDSNHLLVPVFRDGFQCPLGTIEFHRDVMGRVVKLTCHNSRVWGVSFPRVKDVAQ